MNFSKNSVWTFGTKKKESIFDKKTDTPGPGRYTNTKQSSTLKGYKYIDNKLIIIELAQKKDLNKRTI